MFVAILSWKFQHDADLTTLTYDMMRSSNSCASIESGKNVCKVWHYKIIRAKLVDQIMKGLGTLIFDAEKCVQKRAPYKP